MNKADHPLFIANVSKEEAHSNFGVLPFKVITPGDFYHLWRCGKVDKKMTHDERGTRCRIEGPARDGRLIHVICRFQENGNIDGSFFTDIRLTGSGDQRKNDGQDHY